MPKTEGLEIKIKNPEIFKTPFGVTKFYISGLVRTELIFEDDVKPIEKIKTLVSHMNRVIEKVEGRARGDNPDGS